MSVPLAHDPKIAWGSALMGPAWCRVLIFDIDEGGGLTIAGNVQRSFRAPHKAVKSVVPGMKR